MNTVRVLPTLIFILFSSLISISKHFSSYNFIIVAKPSFATLFFMFHFIIIAIFIGRPKPSVEDFEYSFSSLPLPVYEMDRTIQEVEVCGSTGTDYEDDDQSYSTSDGYDHSYHGSDGYDEDNDDDVNDTEGDQDSEGEEYDYDLENKIEAFIYDEDNDDDVNDTVGDQDSEVEEYDYDLENKIEAFIAKVYQERREESQRDRFLRITAG